VNIESITFEFDGKHEHNYYFTLHAQTPESTIDSDIKCRNLKPVYETDLNRTYISAVSGTTNFPVLPSLSVQITYPKINSSCLKIGLWIEPEKIQAMGPHQANISTPDKKLAEEEKNSPTKSSPDHGSENYSPEKNIIRQLSFTNPYESKSLIGEFYISFPKLLGVEMKIFDQKDASLIHKHIVFLATFYIQTD